MTPTESARKAMKERGCVVLAFHMDTPGSVHAGDDWNTFGGKLLEDDAVLVATAPTNRRDFDEQMTLLFGPDGPKRVPECPGQFFWRAVLVEANL